MPAARPARPEPATSQEEEGRGMRGLVTSLMVTMVSPPGWLVRLVTITAEVSPRGRVWWSLAGGG